MAIRTRFAPSPTGLLHIGGVRTALFSWLYARRHGGTFILRIEDTDRERSTDAATQVILDGMEWLGLVADEGPFYQTRRMDRYREVIGEFLQAGNAYHCYCSKEELEAMRARQTEAKQKPRYDGTCRNRTEPRPGVSPVVRFKNPIEGSVVVEDVIHGNVVFDNMELDDLIIARSDGTPTYNFCVVVDDSDMKCTHVIRGDDHLNNTPRQINMLKALGAPVPMYAHVPMILGPDGAKLSKRHGAVSVLQYREDGFLPEALLNYLVRLGWSHGDQEIFSIDEMIQAFDVGNVNRAASRFDYDKLAWLNQHYLKTDDPEAVATHLRWHIQAQGLDESQGPDLADLVVALRDRVKTLKEMTERAALWFAPVRDWDTAAVEKTLRPGKAVVETVAARLKSLQDWSPASVHDALQATADELGLGIGKIAQPMRVAVTGGGVSPSIDHTIYLCGKAGAIQRIDAALQHLG